MVSPANTTPIGLPAHSTHNGLRGMVAEIGVCTARGLARVIGLAEDVLAGEVLDPPDILKEVIHNLREHLMALHARVRGYEDRLKQVAKEDARVRLLRTIPPFGRLLCNRLPGNGTLALSRHRQ